MTLFEIITLGLSILGSGLGILNTWQNNRKDSIRLRVTPVDAIGSNPVIDFGIEVINNSHFAVEVREVGFVAKDGRRAMIMQHVLSDGTRLPAMVEARSEITDYFSKSAIFDVQLAEIKAAYARLPGKKMFLGRSPALTELINAWRSR